MKEMISRRSFLRVMGLGFGAAMLTACKTGTTDSPADSPAASVPDPDTPVPFLTEDEFPRLDGSTACIPLMAQMKADVTGMDLLEAQTSITVSTRPMRGRTSASGPAATARTTAHSSSSSTRPPSTSRKSWPRPTQSSSRKPLAGTRWCSSSTKRIPSRA